MLPHTAALFLQVYFFYPGPVFLCSLAQVISTRSKVLLVFDLADMDLHQHIKNTFKASNGGFKTHEVKVQQCFYLNSCSRHYLRRRLLSLIV